MDRLNTVRDLLREKVHRLDASLERERLSLATAHDAIRDRDTARARIKTLEGLLVKCDECLSGHIIGINCKGPVLDDETVKELRAVIDALEE